MEALKKYFGFSCLREGQDQVVASIMEGRNVLVVMPTGGGKIPVLPASLLVPGRGLPGCQSSNRFNERSGGCSCRQRDSRHHD